MSRTPTGRRLPRDRLGSLRQESRLALARDRAKGAGRTGPDDVTAAWLACFDYDPACEEAAGALIRGYVARGRPEQAARVFERCRAALEELGLRISPSLERIYASVAAARDPEPQVPLATPAAPSLAPPASPTRAAPPGPCSAAPRGAAPGDGAVRRGGRAGWPGGHAWPRSAA